MIGLSVAAGAAASAGSAAAGWWCWGVICRAPFPGGRGEDAVAVPGVAPDQAVVFQGAQCLPGGLAGDTPLAGQAADVPRGPGCDGRGGQPGAQVGGEAGVQP